MKRRFVICMLLTAILLVSSALAAVSVTYEGGAEDFVFLPGSEHSQSDLFENFKDVLPGDELTQKITVKNATGDRVRIYLRADAEGMENKDFLSKLAMSVECRDKEIFDAAPSETTQLTKNTLLGTFKSKGSTELTVTLTVPLELGNEYMSRVGVVPWTFLAEEIPEDSTPDTGDWFQTSVWIGTALVLMMAILLLLILQRRSREEEN